MSEVETKKDLSEPDTWERTTLRDLLVIVFKYKTLIAATFLVTFLTTLLFLWVRAPSYEVKAKVLVRFAREAANPRTSISGSTTRIVAAEVRPDINSEAELIKSYAVIERVVEELGLDRDKKEKPPPGLVRRIRFEMRRLYQLLKDLADEIQYLLAFKERLTPKERAIVEIAERLEVVTVEDSAVIEVTLVTQFKEDAARVLNTLLDFYRDMRLGVDRTPGVEGFFQEQADVYKARLQQSEEALSQLKLQSEIASLPEQIGVMARTVLDVELALQDAQKDLAETEAKVSLLESLLENEASTTVVERVDARSALLDQLEGRRAELLLEKQKLLSKYMEDHIYVQNVEQQIEGINELIAKAEKEVKESRTTGENTVYLELRKQLLTILQDREAAQARLQSLRQTLEMNRNRLNSLQALEVQYRELTREVELNEEQYRLFQRNAGEAKAADALSSGGVTSIAVVDPAVDPIVPIGVRRIYVFAGALAAGLFVGLAFAFILEALDQSISSAEELEREMGVKAIATVPFVPTKKTEALFPPPEAMVQPLSFIATRLELLAETQRPRLVVLSGANAGAGATMLALNTGYALNTDHNRRVLVIEVTHGKSGIPSLTRAEKKEESAEPNDLTNLGEIHEQSLVGGLSVIPRAYYPAGMRPGELADLIGRLPERFADNDYIILDVAASLRVEDKSIVAAAADGMVLVVESDKTRLQVLQSLKRKSADPVVELVGCVLNKRRFYIPDRLYRMI